MINEIEWEVCMYVFFFDPVWGRTSTVCRWIHDIDVLIDEWLMFLWSYLIWLKVNYVDLDVYISTDPKLSSSLSDPDQRLSGWREDGSRSWRSDRSS